MKRSYKRSHEHHQPIAKDNAMTIQLTATQLAVLTHAHEHTEGKIDWFPDTVKGGARQKVLDGLANRGLITSKHNSWFVSAAGYEALGVPRKGPVTLQALDAVIKAASVSADEPAKIPRTRDNSKQAQVIAMLRSPEGATIVQICILTGWQAHTVRGTFAGSFKKKLGLTIESSKDTGGERVYRITPVTPAP
jgi:hypothetical protein